VLSDARGSELYSLHRVLNRGSARAAAAIKSGGIQLLTLANNHIFDYGRRGIGDTIAALDAAGLAHCGTTDKSIHVHQHNGRSYAFLSWSFVPDAVVARKFYNVTEDPKPIIEELQKAASHADKTILSLHAGNEFVGQPSQEFQQLCHKFVDAGADIIIGHHPHVLQPIERYRHGLIAYSLGNSIFESRDVSCRTGMILSASVDDTQTATPIFFHIDQYTHSPILISDPGWIADLTQHVSSVRPLPNEIYLPLVRKLRAKYRRAILLHVMRNLHRTKWRSQFFRSAIARLKYLWSIRKKEKESPNLVYMSRGYLQRNDDL
jgi:hypothetical protein